MFQFASERTQAVKAFVYYLYASRLLKRPPAAPRPAWWSRPIFCGWHEQTQLAFARDGASITKRYVDASLKAKAVCTQANHEKWLDTLERKNCKPGTIIVDALWQVASDINVVETL